MTLTELAKELRKSLRFKWLTLDHTGYVTLWKSRPRYADYPEGTGKIWYRGDSYIGGMCAHIFPNAINTALALEEYADKNGKIDYSKCIVEVE